MTSLRVSRAQELMRDEVSRLLIYKVKDEQLKSVTITQVKMTADLRQAVIRYSVFDEADRENIQRRLEHATGYFKREVGQALKLKFVPDIRFEFDRSLEYARHMDQVLSNLSSGSGDDRENEPN